jgi:gliding motility-associated-like protein
VGTYPITLTGGEDQNYAITLINGTLTIGKKALAITADNKQKIYGEANPTLTFTYSGLVNGDTKVTTEPSIATTATASSNVGTYPITLTGGEDQNYAITLTAGKLEIVPAVLRVTAENKNKVFGKADPAFTYQVSGLKGTDTEAEVLTGILSRQAGEVPGVYAITQGSLKPNANYVMAFTDGNLEIVAARILAVTELGVVQTQWGKDPVLPSKVTVLTTDGQLFEVGVTWNTFGLNTFKRGTYTISGTFNLPNGIENPDGVVITVTIRVAPKPAPTDVNLSNNIFNGNVDTFFLEVGSFLITDPVDNIHLVTLLGDGYDNKYFEIKDNVLFWSSADRAEGKTEFTIVVRVTDRDGNTLDKMFTVVRTRPEIQLILVENTFTPDGDGFNDTWGVPEIRFFSGARVQVFERSGERVFYTEDPDVRWDGTFKGKELPVGTYYWVLELRETGETRRGLLNVFRK